MTSITFFFFLIPVLAVVLLAVNFIFATHTPYEEKNSAFECGFHSFLGQNRMQFNISFYIFGLLFLLFDLEILLIYPYPVSSYFNSIYGLCIMLIFFLVLTLGFAFELGKNALKIDSRQYDTHDIVYKNNKLVESNLFYFNRIQFFITYTLPLWILKNLPYIYIALFIINIISPVLCDPGDTSPEQENVSSGQDNNSNQNNNSSNQSNNSSNQNDNSSNQDNNPETQRNIRETEAYRNTDRIVTEFFQDICERHNLPTDPRDLDPQECYAIFQHIYNALDFVDSPYSNEAAEVLRTLLDQSENNNNNN